MSASNILLNTLCLGLPGFLTKPMYREYESRKLEILKIWEKGYKGYKVLRDYEKVIDSLLSLCIYYRYVLGCMNGASEFFHYLNNQDKRKKDCNIRCGEFRFNREQYNKILSVSIAFKNIKEKYQLNNTFFEFSDTLDFLKNCRELFYTKENISDNKSEKNEENYPF